jgi:hypothetical protein
MGGGPGSDIIAILKFLDENKRTEPIKKIICYLLDKEQAWADTWTELDEKLSIGIALNTNFQPLDVTDPNSWKLQKKFLQSDFFTLSFFVSEVFALDKDGVISDFWKMLFRSARAGALFIYTDNWYSDFTDYFDRLWKDAGLEAVVVEDGDTLTPRLSEQKSELAAYESKFGHSPRLRGRVTYRVLRKP